MSKHLESMLEAMMIGDPRSMAIASYHCSRAHGLSRWQAFRGAVEIYLDYRARERKAAR